MIYLEDDKLLTNDEDDELNGINHNIKIKCESTTSEVFFSDSEFDKTNSRYSCIIKPKELNYDTVYCLLI